jgi:hypothetical protein
VGFIDQTILLVLLPSPQLSEGRTIHLSRHGEAGVCTVVRSGTFGCSRVDSVPKGVTKTSLCDQSNSLLTKFAGPGVVRTILGAVGLHTVAVVRPGTVVIQVLLTIGMFASRQLIYRNSRMYWMKTARRLRQSKVQPKDERLRDGGGAGKRGL